MKLFSKTEIIILLYILIGSIWILTSDFILGTIAPNFNEFQYLSIIKGVGYVVVTGIIFYLILVKIEHNRIRAQKMELLGLATAQISHDLKNIFGIVRGWTQLAQFNKESGESFDKEMNNSKDALNKAQILIDRLLSFTKESKTAIIEMNLNQVIMDFGEKYSNIILSPEITINKQFDPNLPLISANICELHQILLNLILNAQYAIIHKDPPSSPKIISIKTRTEMKFKRKTKTYVVLEVSDTGMGMTPKILKKIFNPFFTTKSDSEGTGLGLAAIAKILNSNHAEIQVQSKLHIGSTFMIYWPVS